MSKNIYILPTDKFQNIKLSLFENKLYLGDIASTALPQHIYITSDEEIKEGDWCICLENIFKNEIFKVDSNVPNKSCNVTLEFAKKYLTKIILTTDTDLIKDGVQETPDEFLEWFVQNPSCEFVKVIKDNLVDYKTILPSNEITPEQLFNDDKRELVKKAILEHKNSNTSPEEELLNNIKYVLSVGNDSQAIRLIEQYGHWKQEGLFSEEDVNEIIAETWNSCEDNEGETYTQARERIINTHKNK